jgi:hypothetical protein
MIIYDKYYINDVIYVVNLFYILFICKENMNHIQNENNVYRDVIVLSQKNYVNIVGIFGMYYVRVVIT